MKNINIKAVTRLTGINENTLRAWERRYKNLDPKRDSDGRRQYSKKDIDKLILLGKLVQQGHLIGHLAERSMSELQTLERELSPHLPHLEKFKKDTQIESEHLHKIIHALKKFDLNQVQASFQTARFELSPKAIINHLVLPLLREVGGLVAQSQLRISQEHLLSSLLRDHLGQIYQSLNSYDYKQKIKSKKIILTTREGDLHEFGILLAAILCRINGHETYYLGPNMPVKDLADACADFKIDSIILGFAQLPQEKEQISASAYLKKLDELAAKKITVLCGGSNEIPISSVKSNRQMMRFSTLSELDQFLQQ